MTSEHLAFLFTSLTFNMTQKAKNYQLIKLCIYL